MIRFSISLLLIASAAQGAVAEALVASHTIRSKSVISAQDLQVVSDATPGALTNPDQAIGMEARVVLYAGRAIRPEDLSSPALVERNQIVVLIFDTGGLVISTDGRALARAGLGERIRVMNLQSRSTVTGTVDAQGRVIVGPSETKLNSMEK